MQPCQILQTMREDFEETARSKALPVKRIYEFVPGAFVEVALDQVDSKYRLVIKSGQRTKAVLVNDIEEALGMAVGVTWQFILPILMKHKFEICESNDHLAAHEFMHLYQAISAYAAEPHTPFEYKLNSHDDEPLFAVEENRPCLKVTINTNHVRNSFVTYSMDVDCERDVLTTAQDMVGCELRNWLKPSNVVTVKAAL